MNKIIKYFENTIVIALMIILAIILVITTYELVVSIILQIKNDPEEDSLIFLNLQELFSIFSFILFIVIGLELFETLKVYLKKHEVPAEIILLVALTAIARKIILLDYDKYDGIVYLGIAAIVVALSFGYFLLKKSLHKTKKVKKSQELE